MSTPPRSPMPGFSSISAHPARNAKIPMGTLTKKIQCQSSDCVRAPPASSPIEPPPADTNAYRPIALACSARAGNSVTMIARITLEAIAPPTPCISRAPIRAPWVGASPQAIEAAVKLPAR